MLSSSCSSQSSLNLLSEVCSTHGDGKYLTFSSGKSEGRHRMGDRYTDVRGRIIL